MSIDLGIYEAHKKLADQVFTDYSKRDTQFDKYTQMYLLNSSLASDDDGVLLTVAPDPRNYVLAAKRLLSRTVPSPSVVGRRKKVPNSDRLEELCRNILWQSNRVHTPIHHNAIESALLYGEVHLAITDVEVAAKLVDPKRKKHVERLAKLTPYLVEAWNPRYGYPVYDSFGLSGYLYRSLMPVSNIRSLYGGVATEWAAGKVDTDKFELSIFYDDENYSVWVEDTVFVAGPHDLPFFPIITSLIDGSTLFPNLEDQRQPLLYGYDKSKMWERQNLALTVLYTNIFNIGINPTFVHTAPPSNPTKTINFDASTSGGVIDLEAGETLGPMVTKGIIDPSFNVGLEIAERKAEESTLYKQAMGGPLAAGSAFATVSLLSQSGRLPLALVQTMCEQVFAKMFEACLIGIKSKNGFGEVKATDIPDDIQMNCKLTLDLPQDKLQVANVAKMLTDAGYVNRTWVRQNILEVEDDQEMDERIAEDRFFESMVQAYMEGRLPQMVQQLIAKTAPKTLPNPTGQQPIPQPPTGLGPEQTQAPDMAELMQNQLPAAENIQGEGFNPGMGGSSSVAAGVNTAPLEPPLG